MSNKVILQFIGDAADLHRTFAQVDDDTVKTTSRFHKLGLGIAKGYGIAGAAGGVFGVAAAGALAGAGLAFVGLGVVAAAQSEQVKLAFTGLKDHVVMQMQKLAEPLVPVLSRIAGQFGRTFDSIAPMLGKAFDATAPYLQTFADGLGKLVTGLLPGFLSAVTAAKPVIDVLAVGLGQIGTGLGQFFQIIGGAAGPASAVFGTLLKSVSDLLPILATLIADVTTNLGPVFSALMPTIVALAQSFGGELGEAMRSLGPPAAALATAFLPLVQLVLPMMIDKITLLAPIIGGLMTIITPLVGFLSSHPALLATVVIAWMAWHSVMSLIGTPLLLISIACRLFGSELVWSTIQMVASRVAMLAWQAVCFLASNAMGILRIAMVALNITMGLNPFMLVVIAIAALVAALVWAYNNVGWFRDGVDAAFHWISNTASTVVGWIVDRWNGLMRFFSNVPGAIGKALGSIGGIIGGAFRGAMNLAIGFINSGIDSINQLIAGINTINPFGQIGMIPHIPKFHSGGVVPGAPGSETLAILQAGETVIPAGGGVGRSGGTVTFAGNTSDAVASMIMQLVREKKIIIT